uniref:Uncharacterized protein n=1 Tax=Candidatus Kentrum sp. SD TaxID=2126332 RepID=A0A451BJU7_9GAMM|nr:MAG: hypothetical protein BECKSD772F_GA0070984_101222 [Candidatus Kentron sp. SD]VFK41498.1 MAG: hypothetical protein BECKSD772E_GA0070983_101221 [Candidatus Kentron sp. SD]VFK78496.1 MAG: hypothetical protein BECKSD772D_GA0070982_101619 [Candidatus Kentron sp. SD]
MLENRIFILKRPMRDIRSQAGFRLKLTRRDIATDFVHGVFQIAHIGKLIC